MDENGLGPRLGPLVVTAVTLSAEHERAEKVALGRPGRAFARINDSKKLVSYKEHTLGEAWARVLGGALGDAASTPAELVAALSLDPAEWLRELCPTEGDHAHQCFTTHGEAFEADDALLAAVRSDLGRLEKRGLRVASVRVAIVCTRRLNDAVDRGVTRFKVDLNAMERLVLDARERSGSDVVAVCGKVGGYNRYPDAFGPLAGRLHAVVCEGRARSEYALPGVGRIAFVRDADEKHLVVCLASLVGKYVRDSAHGARRPPPQTHAPAPSDGERLPRPGDDALHRRHRARPRRVELSVRVLRTPRPLRRGRRSRGRRMSPRPS